MNKAFKLDKKSIEDIVNLTSLQEGILFHYLKNANKNLYFVQLSLEIQGAVKFDYFREAWNKVIADNEMLRTVFRWEKLNKPIQVILKDKNADIRYYDLSKEGKNLESEYQKIRHKDSGESFDLREVPFRLTLCKIKEDKYRLLISNHHIIYDGWSNGIILKEFLNYYNGLVTGSSLNANKKAQFKDYLKLNREPTIEDESFWKDYLKEFEAKNVFSFKNAGSSPVSLKNGSHRFSIPENKFSKLEQICKSQKITIADILYGAWGILLSKYSGEPDILFGTTISGRNIKFEGIERMVGLFINTIPLRQRITPGETLISVLKENAKQTLERGQFENVPLRNILDYSGYKESELIESIFVVENYPLDKENLQDQDKLAFTSFKIQETTNYKLTVSALLSDEIEINLNYINAYFQKEIIENIEKHYVKIIDTIINDNKSATESLDLLSDIEKQQLLYDFNNTRRDYPEDKTIHHLLEEQANKIPGAQAIIFVDEKISYEELNKKSGHLASYLASNGIVPGDKVGLIVGRSLEMLVGIFGILKAGGAYVPIDPAYPGSRVKYILESSESKLVLSERIYARKIEYPIPFTYFENIDFSKTTAFGNEPKVVPGDLAYIIYTSGSTGNPKGVQVEHRSVTNLLYFLQDQYPITTGDSYLLKTSYCFDVSISEIFGWILGGGKLAILEKDHEKEPSKIMDAILRNKITHINFVPTALKSFSQSFSAIDQERLKSLKYLLIAGEALYQDHLQEFNKLNLNIHIANLYGPTEATVYTSHYTVNPGTPQAVPIGKPISNYSIFILDNTNKLQPIGLPGELCVSGVGVARGYMGNPTLTKEKFIDHPFKEGERLYKTGDLARWLPNGDIDFLGRIDDQIKIRGFRIELGEIENVLQKHEEIKECVVLAIKEKEDKYLCAYVVSEEDFNREEIRTYLSASLPDYMIPSYFVELEKIPLTSNGKLDRKSLPAPEIRAGSAYMAPKTVLETKLVKIWSEVLNVASKEISTNVSFFELGGHSLKATVLVSRIHKELDVQLELREVFKFPTIQAQAEFINSSESSSYFSIPKTKAREYYALSSSQRRLYLLQQIDLENTLYNMPGLIAVPKGIRKQEVRDVFSKLIQRHESLRTSFELDNEFPVQRINSDISFSIKDYEVKSEEITREQENFIQAFDLSVAPLLRVAYLEIIDGEDMLLVDMHHIISDGRSHEILEKEFHQLLAGKELEPLCIQYKDYSEWQNSKEQQERIKEQEGYWLDKFTGELPVLELPTDYSRSVMQSFEGASVSFTLSTKQTETIHDLCKNEGLTLYMSLLAIFTILLSKLSGQEDIIVGSPIAARRHADLQDIVGMFVNTLAIRSDVSGDKRLSDYLQEFKENILEAYENQEYQFEDLVEKLVVNRDAGRNPIFDVMFNLLNQTEHSGNISGIDKQEHEIGISKFDLTFTAIDYGDQIMLNFEYCTKLFKAETIDKFIAYFKQIVSQFAIKTEVKICEIDILTEEEKQQLLYDFNNTVTDYPKDKTIHQLFEEQVSKNADRILVSKNDTYISYNEINIRSNQLAWQLKELGVNLGDVVGLNTDRTGELIIGILGILKCGAAYLPLNSSWPKERINFMLSDSCCKILIHGESFKPDPGLECQFLDINNVEPSKNKCGNLEVEVSPSNIIYIIYTSGTTGNPKGVLTTHSNVSRVVLNTNYLSIKESDKILQLSSYTFDGSVFDIYGALLNGSGLVMLNEDELLNIDQLLDIISKQQASIFFITTALFNAIVDYGMSKLKDVRKILFGGERISVQHTQKALGELGEGRLVHVYGPTETTVFASFHNINNIDEGRETIPIGKPISNTTVYLLDKARKIVPSGVPGEIYIGSCGNALGYLNNVELTKEKFVGHPYKVGERLYRTGDLACYLPDGSIEFLERIDHQVKIRGFRIELGEIESALIKHENIKESVVLAIEKNNEKYLCAYVVSKVELNHEELRIYISSKLPDYMVPSHFVEMESLPLNTNGKVNRNALPSPDIKAGDNYVAPKTKEESLLVDVWSKVLGVEGIGIIDNFFSLGGDSIKTIQIQARLNTAGFKIDVKDIFLNPTILDLAPKMVHKASEVPQEVVIGNLKLSPIQYYFLSDETEQHHFNQSIMLHSDEYLEEEKIQTVFRKLQEHHDALRITCKVDKAKKITGLYNNGIEDFPVSLEVHDFRQEKEASDKITTYAGKIQRSIDLENGPLMKLGLFHLPDGDRLLVVIHHLVIDGISWRIIFEDIETLFNQLNKGEKFGLPLKSNSFRDWSAKLTEYAKSSLFLKEKSYWRNIVKEEEFSLNRQTDNENIEDNEIGQMQFTLDQTTTSGLLNNTNEVYGTEINDILLCGLGYSIKKTLGNEKVLISLEGHGREDIFPGIDINRTIGWFTSMYPVLLDMKNTGDLSLQIRNVKEHLRQVPNKGIGFGILKYLTPPELKDGVNYDIEPQIEFNYLGQFDSDVEQMSLFKIAEEPGGDTISPKRKNKCDFSIGGMISNGKLSITLSYKKKYYSKELIDNLLENYKKSLLEIIDHCTKHKGTILTPSDFTYRDLSIKEVDKLVKQYEIEDIYKLTPMQEGMLFHAMHDPESLAYFVQMNYRLNSDVSLEIMQKSLNELFNRHEILRTVYIHKDVEIPIQIVLKNRECEFNYEDIRHLNFEEKEEYISSYKTKDKKRGFILDHDVLMRVSLLQLNNNEYELIWSNHHILMDGWCLSILNNDFFEIYNSLLNKRTLKLNSITPYKEYVKWLDGIDKDASLKYWENYLSGYEEQALLPKLSSKGNEFVQQKEQVQLSKEVSAKFQKIASDNSVTANTILQAVWAILLGKYSNKEDIVFGSVVSGRPSEIYGVESIVGLFINNVPVRIQFSQDLEFSTLIKKVQNSNLHSETHHFISLADIQAQSILKQNLIDHIIVFENYPIAEKMEKLDNDNEQLDIKISGVDTFEQTNYNLTINASLSDVLHVDFIYNANIFDSGMMKGLKLHFENVINHIVSDSEVKISGIDILTREEKHQLLHEFNNTEAGYPKDKTIHQLFEEQVERTPENTAVCYNGTTLSYRELNRKANVVAHRIREIGIDKDDIVSIFLDRSIETVISMLGVLKSGGAYLPLDPDYPDDRIDFILNDSHSKTVISTKDLSGRIGFEGSILCVEELLVLENNISNIEKINKPSDLCYIIYTSGTTGMPKGVMIEHRNAVRLFFNDKFQFDFSEKDVWTMFHSHCFDFSVWEMYGALLYGGKLIVIPKIVAKDVVEYYKILHEEKVTVLNQTPSAFYNLTEIALQEPGKKLENLRYVIFGGEALKPNKLEEWFNIYPGVKLINMYGITETTVHVTYKEIDEYEIVNNISNIGISIPTLTTYVVDKNLQLVPKGVAGELLIGGDGLSRGYLGKEDLTKEKFIQNPYNPEERLYRSGDLVKMLSSGEMEYLGRIDHQVQLRGFRIELGEIENTLLKLERINECVVLAREENGEKYLCAYLVCKEVLNHEELRAFISLQLPDYMVPSYFVELESLPLTANGKVNRKVLPSPEIKAGNDYVAPSNEIEEKLVKIWSEVLNIDKEDISVNANFFSIGGHSLKATMLIGKIYKETGVKLPLSDVFVKSTVKEQAGKIINGIKKSFIEILPVQKKDYYETSSLQKRIYIQQKLDPETVSYNMPSVLILHGELNLQSVKEAFRKIVKRHEAFRTSFRVINKEIVQIINNEAEIPCLFIDSTENEWEQELKSFVEPFNIEKAPLFRYKVVKIAKNKHALLVDMHHIIADGVSRQILIKEFTKLYNNELLGDLTIQYKDFANWHNRFRTSEEYQSERVYWHKIYKEKIPTFEVPSDFVRPKTKDLDSGDSIDFELDENTVKEIDSIVNRMGSTTYMFLLTIFKILLAKLSGIEDIVMGTLVAGRSHDSLNNSVGMFVNTLALRNTISGELSFQENFENIKQNTLESFDNQMFQIDDLINELGLQGDADRNPLINYLFNMNNMDVEEFDMPGIKVENYTKLEDNFSKFDLQLVAYRTEDTIKLNLRYYTKMFKKSTVEGYTELYTDIIDQVVSNNNLLVKDISMTNRLTKITSTIETEDEFNFDF